MSEALSLFSLFASSFLSATLLPGNSEVVLVAMLLSGVSHPWVLVLTATMGNSLGGLTNVILGRFFPLRKTSRWQEKAIGWLKRYGAITLLLSWMPVIGDLLCLLAGWMRISWGPVIFFLCLGKALRYVAIAVATVQGMMWWH
ncbi:YqaA family protein [Escherichia sp. E4742]|uniref:YqaA family protein n=1 Tax=Escherichia sp. E4742 TaxID=2044467 RepID=UPI0010FD58D3|nr:YqaA family protein [Escherichia sp. E4742]QLN20221.1 DedA family protein [Escherichia coli]QCT86325.1 DedA family protein [Escherichia sp. E4742]QML57380.1 DedA family protein [Escherichia coli]TLJ05557.1 DedA family protein [Escherichia sp. E4742]WFW63708.1 DedA family protein [Escherichia coli]